MTCDWESQHTIHPEMCTFRVGSDATDVRPVGDPRRSVPIPTVDDALADPRPSRQRVRLRSRDWQSRRGHGAVMARAPARAWWGVRAKPAGLEGQAPRRRIPARPPAADHSKMRAFPAGDLPPASRSRAIRPSTGNCDLIRDACLRTSARWCRRSSNRSQGTRSGEPPREARTGGGQRGPAAPCAGWAPCPGSWGGNRSGGRGPGRRAAGRGGRKTEATGAP